MEVPILKQGAFLIATFQAALSDADLNQLRMGLVQQVVKFRSRAVIVDESKQSQASLGRS